MTWHINLLKKFKLLRGFADRVMPPKVALRASDSVDPGQTVLRSVKLHIYEIPAGLIIKPL